MKHMKRSTRLISLVMSAALVFGLTAGCEGDNQTTPTPAASPPTVTPSNEVNPTPTPTAVPTEAPAVKTISTGFAPEFGKAGKAYVPIEVTPNVAGYTIAPDLSNVVNLDQLPDLTAAQKLKLAKNGFVVAASDQKQLFYIYEDNEYKLMPSFVTADSMLQVFHIYYDYALRSVEGSTLLPTALKLNQNMLLQLKKEYDAISEPAVKAEALKALAYFGVAQLAFGEKMPEGFPEEAAELVKSEMKLFDAADARYPSPIFGYEIDYSLLAPRGHYTRSDDLKRYFKGMAWYGTIPFPMYEVDGKTRNTKSALRSIIITEALCGLPKDDGGALWENIYSPTQFFVGAADDFTPSQFAEIIEKVYGENPDLNKISYPSKLDLFYEEIEKLPKAQINAKNDVAKMLGQNIAEGPQYRFMGQRYIPDSEILQELSEPIVRPFPTGLDVFASLGSKRAADIIASRFNPTAMWPEYTENFERMKEKFTTLKDSTWQSNMYYGWLWTQNSLTGEYGEGYPTFMRNTAWQDKSLSSALGSWAEMRHDTILYAKGTAAEKGGDGPPEVKSYVEPNPEFFNRLLWLTEFSRDNLNARGLLPKNIKFASDNMIYILTFLRDCAVKELKGEDLSERENRSLLYYGGWLENLTSNCVENGGKWYMITSETDRNMAVIADVHTAYSGVSQEKAGYLEEAVGTANEIYVIVPVGDKLYITRGAVFDYYEFVSDERLTDEKWQSMLKAFPPERPGFTSSFIEGKSSVIPAKPIQHMGENR